MLTKRLSMGIIKNSFFPNVADVLNTRTPVWTSVIGQIGTKNRWGYIYFLIPSVWSPKFIHEYLEDSPPPIHRPPIAWWLTPALVVLHQSSTTIPEKGRFVSQGLSCPPSKQLPNTPPKFSRLSDFQITESPQPQPPPAPTSASLTKPSKFGNDVHLLFLNYFIRSWIKNSR